MSAAKPALLALLLAPALACTFEAGFELNASSSAADSDEPAPMSSHCGPTTGVVKRVIDGDTIELQTGERIRYLMIDTPESTSEQECWGEEAKAANASFVEGKEVELSYDEECTDSYNRLLAYVFVDGTCINELMIERGHACVFHIPPNGEHLVESYDALETAAQTGDKGLWAACDLTPC